MIDCIIWDQRAYEKLIVLKYFQNMWQCNLIIVSLSNMCLWMFKKMSASDDLYESTHCVQHQNLA